MKKSVIILGGGIAGLAAARQLAHHNFAVAVIEAQDRLGGRIRTLRHAHAPIELGAEFIHGESKPLLEAVRDAGLETQPVSGKNQVVENGRFEDFDIWDRAGEIFRRINLNGPDTPFEEFLARQKDLDERAREATRHFVEGFNAAHVNRISSHALLRAEQSAEKMNGSLQLRVTPGYSALVDFFANEIKKLNGVVITNARAQQIIWKPKHVEVAVEIQNQLKIFTADAAIVTLPLGILKADEIEFHPALPDKVEAVRNLDFGNIVKVIFEFREAFWGDLGFFHALDRQIPTWWHDPRGPILIGWAGGSYADALLKYSHSELEQIGLEILGSIFSESKNSLRDRMVASHYWNWAADPFIRGAYSYIPVHRLDFPKLLAAPVAETLFFAGEATVTDAQMGTVSGALETGLRAARELMKSP